MPKIISVTVTSDRGRIVVMVDGRVFEYKNVEFRAEAEDEERWEWVERYYGDQLESFYPNRI